MFARLLSAVLLVVVAAMLLVLAWPQLFGLQQAWGVAHVVALRAGGIVVALGGLVLLGLLALARPLRALAGSLAVLLVAFIALNGIVLASRGSGGTEFAASDDAVTVLSWNTLGDAPGSPTIAQLALDTGADIVTLPETSRETAIEVAVLMRDGGSPMWVVSTGSSEVVKARSTSLLVSAELGQYRVDDSFGTTRGVPSLVAVPIDGDGPRIVSAHPVAPIPGYFADWQSGLDWAARACTGDDVIMAGDFNATLDHMAGLGTSGEAVLGDCRDAASDAGTAAVGTWPTRAPALLGSAIDHVFATPSWTTTSMSVLTDHDDAGSDHRPVIATLERTAP